MRKPFSIFLIILLITGCHGTTRPPAPLLFSPAAENKLRYRFAVPPPMSIEKHPLTLYGKKSKIQKMMMRVLDNYSRFSTCVAIPMKEAGTLEKELKLARKKGADFLLRSDIILFEAKFKGRNSRIIPAYALAFTFFGLIIAWDVAAKTWIGDGVIEVTVFDCTSGNPIYSSTIKAEALCNFTKHDELMEREMGKNYIRYTLGRLVLSNLMVSLVEDLNDNFTKSLTGHEEEAPDVTPTVTSEEEPPAE